MTGQVSITSHYVTVRNGDRNVTTSRPGSGFWTTVTDRTFPSPLIVSVRLVEGGLKPVFLGFSLPINRPQRDWGV